jgi:hypothetical protein
MFKACGALLEDLGSGVVEYAGETEGETVEVGEGEAVCVAAGEYEDGDDGDSIVDAAGKGDGEEFSEGAIVGKLIVCRGAGPPAAMLPLSE